MNIFIYFIMSSFLNLQSMNQSSDEDDSNHSSEHGSGEDENSSNGSEKEHSSPKNQNESFHSKHTQNTTLKENHEKAYSVPDTASTSFYEMPTLLSAHNFFTDKPKLRNLVKDILKKIINYNVTEQNFEELSQKYKNEKFYDYQFPPNENSLIKGYNSNIVPTSLTTDIPFEKTPLQKNWKSLKWKRQSEFLKYKTLFPEEIRSFDIKVNEYSNPNFISVLSALSEYPERIVGLFKTTDTNESGMYCVQMCKDGLMKEIIIDDYLPVDSNGNLAFSEDNQNSLWIQILEKCYAKAYGSYNLIGLKDVEGMLRDLTFAPVITLDNSNDDLIQELNEAYEKKWIILASAGDTEASQELLRELGLKPDYEYPILIVYGLTIKDLNGSLNNTPYSDENYKTILKIRNLWSEIEWIGDWSDISTFWNNDFKQKLEYEPNDKCFYMNLKDFKHYFSKIKICKYEEDYHYKSIQIIQKPEEYALVEFTISEDHEEGIYCYLSFVQQDRKNYLNNEYVYGISRIILCMLTDDDKVVEYIEGKMGQEREIILQKELYPGKYIVFCELSKIDKETPYVFSVYSSYAIDIRQVENDFYPKILENIYISCAKIQGYVSRFEQEGAPNCYKYSTSTVEGYTYIYFENNEKDATLIEDVKYTKFEGLKLLSPFSGTSYRVEIGPGEREIILIKHLELNEYNLIFSYQSSIQFGKETLMKLAKDHGTKKKRKDKKTETELDIDVYIYKHTFGLCYYYENNTDNKRLKETLNITNNTNVDFVGEKEGTNEVMITIEPHQTFFIELRGKNNLWKVQPLITYTIETIGEQS